LIRSVYLIAHETLRTQWQGPISFKRGKEWIQQDPSKWQVREALSVNLGASVGERQRIAAVFDSLLNKQATLAQNGMEDVLVDVTAFFNAAMQWLRINDVDNPEKYFIDPRSPQAKQALKDKAAQRQQAQQKQDAMMQQAVGLEQVRVALSKYQTDVETQFKYYNSVLNAQIEEAKLAVQGVVDLVKTRKLAQEAQGNGKDSTNTADDSAGESAPGESGASDSAATGGG